MRGATLFFLALLVVVGSGRRVCLKADLNNVVIVEGDLLLAAQLLGNGHNRPIVLGWFFRQICVKNI